jgi:hypothetical protein
MEHSQREEGSISLAADVFDHVEVEVRILDGFLILRRL